MTYLSKIPQEIFRNLLGTTPMILHCIYPGLTVYFSRLKNFRMYVSSFLTYPLPINVFKEEEKKCNIQFSFGCISWWQIRRFSPFRISGLTRARNKRFGINSQKRDFKKRNKKLRVPFPKYIQGISHSCQKKLFLIAFSYLSFSDRLDGAVLEVLICCSCWSYCPKIAPMSETLA